MNVNVRKVEQVAILDLTGRVVIGEALYDFRNTVRDMLNEGFTQILLNMENVTYLDSSGIGELVNCYTLVSTQGGSVKLVKAAEKIGSLLQMTKLLTVFESYKNEREAIASFVKS